MKAIQFRLVLVTVISSFLVLLLTACNGDGGGSTEAAANDITYHQYENVAAFDVLYPEGWTYLVLGEGTIMFGPPGTVSLDVDPTVPNVTILRESLSAQHGVRADFDHFLENGPLKTDFEIVEDTVEVALGNSEAYRATVTDGKSVIERGTTAMLIIGRSEQTNATYTLVFSAPSDVWDVWKPRYEVMASSFKFNE